MTAPVVNVAANPYQPAVKNRFKLPWSIRLLLLYLAAITIIGKGATFIGYPPVFWGELVMLVSVGWVIDRHGFGNAFVPFSDALTACVGIYMLVGLAITATCIPLYGVDAVRDAAIWYYGIFFFVGAQIARQAAMGDAVWRALRLFWLAALVWGVADISSGLQLQKMGPVIPGRDLPLLSNSHAETVEHVGLAALIVLNPFLIGNLARRWRPFFVVLGLVGIALAFGSNGRGVKVGLLVGITAVMPFYLAPGRSLEISKRLVVLIFTLLLLVLSVVILFEEDLPYLLSVTRLDRFADADISTPKGSAQWRMIWWQRLLHQVEIQNPLFGLGFGQSLNIYHPLLQGVEKEQWPVRSPHNFNITVLARMGIIGTLLWMLILIAGIGGLWFRIWNGRLYGIPYTPERREELAFWMMMLITTWTNSTFGVLMEGPVLGVWFWFALGFAWARSKVVDPVPAYLYARENAVGMAVSRLKYGATS